MNDPTAAELLLKDEDLMYLWSAQESLRRLGFKVTNMVVTIDNNATTIELMDADTGEGCFRILLRPSDDQTELLRRWQIVLAALIAMQISDSVLEQAWEKSKEEDERKNLIFALMAQGITPPRVPAHVLH